MSQSFTIQLKYQWPSTISENPKDHHLFLTGISLPNSSAGEYGGNSKFTNPEELLLSSLCSCHFLTFHALCQKKRLELTRYEDRAQCELEKNEQGKMCIKRITLNPQAQFAANLAPVDREQYLALHAKAHEHCFIANSLLSRVEFGEQTQFLIQPS